MFPAPSSSHPYEYALRSCMTDHRADHESQFVSPHLPLSFSYDVLQYTLDYYMPISDVKDIVEWTAELDKLGANLTLLPRLDLKLLDLTESRSRC
jgi:hypothetical protein